MKLYSSYWNNYHRKNCHWGTQDYSFTGEVYYYRVYRWSGGYTAGFRFWWRYDGSTSTASHKLDPGYGYYTYSEYHINGPMIGMGGRSGYGGNIFNSLRPRSNLCYCPRATMTFTQMGDINTEMGV
jgi:hypothetical protein